ncbi:MAG: DUF6293 family protein [Archaeoglobales archaeon]|nr:DUF6293 family protein [Archaeoglobales archaeon]
MQFVHIILAGNNAEIILDSIKVSGHPIHKSYVLYDDENSKKVAENIKRVLSSLIDVELIEVNDKRIYSAVWEILKIARREKDLKNEILINLTGANQKFSLAGLIAAQISGGKVYTYKNGEVEVVQKPPVKDVNGDKMMILKVLDNEGGEVDSINRLIELVEGKIEEHKRYMAQRARMSYHLNGLEEDGLVVTERQGKNLKIKLTDLGKAFVLMFG